MQELDSSNDEWVKELEGENEESKFTGRRLVKKSISVPELVDEVEEDLDDFTEPADDFNDKVGKKRQRKKKDESGLEKTKKNKKQNSEEVQEMWDSITNNTNSQVCLLYKSLAHCSVLLRFISLILSVFIV